MNKTMKKEKESGFLKSLKNLKVMKKLFKSGFPEKDTTIRERADLFWEAEADILREDERRILRERVE